MDLRTFRSSGLVSDCTWTVCQGRAGWAPGAGLGRQGDGNAAPELGSGRAGAQGLGWRACAVIAQRSCVAWETSLGSG